MQIEKLKQWWADNTKGLKYFALVPGHLPAMIPRKQPDSEDQPGEPGVVATQPNGDRVHAFKTKSEREQFLKDCPGAEATDGPVWELETTKGDSNNDAGGDDDQVEA